MSDRDIVLVDLLTSCERLVSLREAARISELHIEDVEWALEEYGFCETDQYRIIDTE